MLFNGLNNDYQIQFHNQHIRVHLLVNLPCLANCFNIVGKIYFFPTACYCSINFNLFIVCYYFIEHKKY